MTNVAMPNAASMINGEITALEARFGRVPGVSFADRFGGPAAVLTAGSATAVVALKGAQVLSWRPNADSKDVLWLSPNADFSSTKAVRGGIPICWPWFGPHPGDPSKPAHGFVRTTMWQVAGSAASPGRARLVLKFDTRTVAADTWPHRLLAEVEITLGETLSVSLTTENASAMPIEFSEALHTYLNVGDISDIELTGLDQRSYIDQLDGGAIKRQSGTIVIDREIDRIYQDSADDVIVSDKSWARDIRVAKSGSAATVVWNPWIEKAQRLGDMGADGYRRMICVETANAGKNTVTLAPRARHRVFAELTVNQR